MHYLDTTSPKFEKYESLLTSIFSSYMFIIKSITTNELKILLPKNPKELLVSLIITTLLLYATIKLISGFTTMMSISNYSMGNYEHNIDGLRIYLQVIVSVMIVKQICKKSSKVYRILLYILLFAI